MSGGRLRTAEVVDAFIDSRRARRVSEKHVESLRYRLGFLRAEFLPERVEDLESLLASLDVGDETALGVWSTWRSLYRWAAARYGVADVAAGLGRPLVRRKVRRRLTEVEVERLLWSARRRSRDYALLLLLLDTGARIGEVVGLGWRDVGDHTVVLCRGKTGEREVPITRRTWWALSELGSDPLFASQRGGALTVRGLQQVVCRALRRAGLRGGPHLLRHTFARLYLRRGGSVAALQRILGHRKVETTMVYAELELSDIEDEHARCSPVAVARLEGRQLALVGGV